MKTNWELALVSLRGNASYRPSTSSYVHCVNSTSAGGPAGGAGAVPAQVRAALPRVDEGPLSAR